MILFMIELWVEPSRAKLQPVHWAFQINNTRRMYRSSCESPSKISLHHHGIFSFDVFSSHFLPFSIWLPVCYAIFSAFLSFSLPKSFIRLFIMSHFFRHNGYNDAVKAEIVVVKFTPFSNLRHKMQNTQGKRRIRIKCSCLSNNAIRYSISHKRRDNTDNDNDCDGDEVTIRRNPEKKSNKIFRGRWGQLVSNCTVHTAHGSHVTKLKQKITKTKHIFRFIFWSSSE